MSSRDGQGKVRARLPDFVPGRSKKAYADWIGERSEAFRSSVQVAALDPSVGYKIAIADELADATAVLDAFHVVKLGTQAVEEVRRRVQQETLGHRGRKGDSLYGIQKILRAGAENLTDPPTRPPRGGHRGRRNPSGCLPRLALRPGPERRYRCADLSAGRAMAERILAIFHTCPVPEIARCGMTFGSPHRDRPGRHDGYPYAGSSAIWLRDAARHSGR